MQKPLPAELKEKLLNTLTDREIMHKSQFDDEHIEMSNSIAESILGIELD